MARMRLLNEMKGSSFEGFCIVKSVAERANVKGAMYLDFVLADCEGEGVAKLWDYNKTEMGVYEADDVVKVRGTISVWKDVEQLKLERLRHTTEADEVDMSRLLPCAPFDPVWMFDALYQEVEAFQNEDIKRITQYLLRENKERLLFFPAAVKLHHATRGGLLHHSWSIVQLAHSVARQYPALDADLLIAGAILHDIGKLQELDTGTLGLAGAYTPAGQLLGHISLGIQMIGSVAELLGIDSEVPMLLEHMLLSHHGTPEYGSPRFPMFPEAEVLSELDLLDSKLYEMFSALDSVQPGGFSERQWALDNRQLYKRLQ